jgi:hypothetical protein
MDRKRYLDELRVDIPEDMLAPELDVKQNDQGDTYETTLEGINDLIKNLTTSLDVCDKKARDVDQDPTQEHDDNYEPISNPDAWWDVGVRHVFDWLRESFHRKLCYESKTIIERANITFFSWKEYTGKITLDAASCSLTMMLKPWTAPNILFTEEVCYPQGVSERKEDANVELCTLSRTAERIVQQFENDACDCTSSNPALSEVLNGCANAMKTLLALRDKEQEYVKTYRRDTRYNAVIAVNAIAIVQKWVFSRSIEKTKAVVDCYLQYSDQIRASFMDPIKKLMNQKDQFRGLWEQVKYRYDRFLKTKGLKNQDESAADAMDIICSFSNVEDFGIDNIKLMKNYVMHMKRLAYSNTVGKRIKRRRANGTLEEDTSSASRVSESVDGHQGNNPVKELHHMYEKQKAQLTEINKQISKLKAETEYELSEKKIKQIQELEEKRKSIVKSTHSNASILKNYSDCDLDEHNRWLEALERLEDRLETAIQEWGKIYGQKFRREAQLEEEIKNTLQSIMANTYKTCERDYDHMKAMWHEKQTRTDKTKDEELRKISMERYVANEWLCSFEGKLVYYCNSANDYVKSISEFRAVHSMLAAMKDNYARIQEFEEAFDDMVQLWKLVYNFDCGNTDACEEVVGDREENQNREDESDESDGSTPMHDPSHREQESECDCE